MNRALNVSKFLLKNVFMHTHIYVTYVTYTYIHIHTYIHTYIYTHIRTYDTYIHTYINTYDTHLFGDQNSSKTGKADDDGMNSIPL